MFKKKRIALTFDDGYKYTVPILEKLEKHHVKATFFVCGDWMERNAEGYKKIFDGKHEIANHSYSHIHMDKLSDEEVLTEIDRVQQLSRKLVGKEGRWFRFPYGKRDERLCRLVHKKKMRSVGWTIDTRDWENISAEEILRNVMENVKDGDIVLMHTLGEHTVEALDLLIPALKESGYKMVKLSELINNMILYFGLRRRKIII